MTIEFGASLTAIILAILNIIKSNLDKKDVANKNSEDRKSYDTEIKLLKYKTEQLENRVNNVDGKLDKIVDELRNMNLKLEKFISNNEGKNEIMTKILDHLNSKAESGRREG